MLGRNPNLNKLEVEFVKRESYENEREYLQQQITMLEVAFDAFFDAVASDLGYEAQTEYRYPFSEAVPVSPRKLQMTAPSPEIVRHETARCKRASTAPSAKEK